MTSVHLQTRPAKSLRANVRAGLIWSAMQSWGGRLAVLGLFMVVARMLAPEDIGLFAMASAMMYLLAMLTDQGLVEAVVQRAEVTPEQMNTVFFFNMGLALLLMTGVWIAAPWLAVWFKAPQGADLLRVLAVALPLSAANLGQIAMKKRGFEYRWLALTNLASTVGGCLLALALILGGAGVWGLVVQWVVSTGLLTLMFWTRPGWRFSRQIDLAGTLPLFRYGLSRISSAIIDFANTRYIEFFLVATLGPAVLAVYAVGVRIQQAMMQALSGTAYEIAHNGFSRLADDRPALLGAYYKSLVATTALIVPMFCLIAAVAAPLTSVLFGTRWLDSANVTRIVCVLGAIQLLQLYNGTLLNAIGRPSVNLHLMISKLVLTVMSFELVRGDGFQALLSAYFISQVAIAPVSFFAVRRLVGVSLHEVYRQLWPFVAGSILMSAAAVFVLNAMESLPPLLELVAATAAGGLVYVGFIGLVAPDTFRRAIVMIKSKQ